MKRFLLLALLMPFVVHARHKILLPNFQSLEVMVNHDFTRLPIMTLNSGDVLYVSFDELSHTYHRLIYQLEPCNPDWTPAEGLFESDWLDGFNSRPIDDYQNSVNTNVLYTHYKLHIPNDDTKLKMSGNYRLHILDEDDGDAEVIVVEFCVVEPLMNVALGITTNTDIDLNQSHQQATMTVGFGPLTVTSPADQVQTFVMQNGREDNMKVNVKPNYTTVKGLTWEHNRAMIFDAGNEYHKFEVLDPSHTTMGLAHVEWDEEAHRYHAFPYTVEPRRSYIYEVDANGAFLLRNSDNYEAEYTSEYVLVHYKAKIPFQNDIQPVIDGRWTTGPLDNYILDWDETDQTYNAVILQKLGYYNYQLLLNNADGTVLPMPEEGSFYQTENLYTALVYYKATGARSWRLVGHCDTKFRSQ